MISIDEKYKENFEKAKKLIDETDYIRVYSHYDADGVSSASIIVSVLSRLNKKFHLSFQKQLDLEEISRDKSDLVIICDLGADGLAPEDFAVIIVDHHEPPISSEKIVNLNPRSYGYDGTREACSSTVAFILSLFIDEKNSDLNKFFLTGAIGDKQWIGGFRGINKLLIDYIGLKQKKTLNLDGIRLLDAIVYSTDPFFQNYTGYEDKVRELLDLLGIDKESKISELSEDHIEKLNNMLFLELLKGNTSKEGLDALISDDFIDQDSGLSINHLSSLFDAAGRNNRMGLPSLYAMGNKDSLIEMVQIEKDFKRRVIEEVRKSVSSAYEMKHINVMEVDEESMTGIVASTGMIYFLNKNKPTISFSKNAKCKISSRATYDLINKGVNLSKAMNAACISVGGHGGGHDIAAGGTIPVERLNDFLLNLDKIIGDQIGDT